MSAEYPGALWVPAHPSNFRKAGRATFLHIAIHCTDGHERAEPVAAMWQQPGHGSSAHFVVGQDGTIIQSVSIDDIAFHAHSANRTSIGVEHCCRTPGELGANDPGLKPSPIQLAASAKLTAWLCRCANLSIDRDTIQGHAEIDPVTTHRLCPTGAGINLDEYVALVLASDRKA